jgi:hypothetical protein
MPVVQKLPETGMGYTIVSITLVDGRTFDQAIIASGYLHRIRGRSDVPFSEDDIADIRATHDKWDWRSES